VGWFAKALDGIRIIFVIVPVEHLVSGLLFCFAITEGSSPRLADQELG
jgi:hypothetical protein